MQDAHSRENEVVASDRARRENVLCTFFVLLGTGCEAIDHWNNQKAEIGNPAKEALIRQMYGSITFGNEFKPAYNFNAASETIKITVISQNLEE